MAVKKVYVGSVGPFLFDDSDSIDDSDGDFSGETQKGITSNGPIYTENTPSDDYDVLRLADFFTQVRRYSTVANPSENFMSKPKRDNFRYHFMMGI